MKDTPRPLFVRAITQVGRPATDGPSPSTVVKASTSCPSTSTTVHPNARHSIADHQIAVHRIAGHHRAERRTVDHHQQRFRCIEHGRKRHVKRIEQLKHAPLRIFAQLDAAAECLPRGIEHDQLDIVLLAENIDAAGKLAEHALVQQIVVGAIEREAGDFAIDLDLEELEFLDLGRDQRQCAEDFDACAARRLM